MGGMVAMDMVDTGMTSHQLKVSTAGNTKVSNDFVHSCTFILQPIPFQSIPETMNPNYKATVSTVTDTGTTLVAYQWQLRPFSSC